jgi:hypothetical protein
VGLLLDDVEHVRVSDVVIRNDREDAGDFVAIRVTGGRENVISDNVFAGEVDIAPGTANVEGNR